MANDASYFSITTAITTAITDGLPILEAKHTKYTSFLLSFYRRPPHTRGPNASVQCDG